MPFHIKDVFLVCFKLFLVEVLCLRELRKLNGICYRTCFLNDRLLLGGRRRVGLVEVHGDGEIDDGEVERGSGVKAPNGSPKDISTPRRGEAKTESKSSPAKQTK